MSQDAQLSDPVECGHCGNCTLMRIVRDFDCTVEHSTGDWDPCPMYWIEGHVYEVLQCPVCSQVSFRRYYWHDGMMEPPDINYEPLHPPVPSAPLGLPVAIRRAWEEAAKVRRVSPNAYAVHLGRMLELVCRDRQAEGKDLDHLMKDLAKRENLPPQILEIVKGLRLFRNVGAHGKPTEEISAAETSVLHDLARAVLEFVYTGPYLAAKADETYRKMLATSRGQPKGGPASLE